jgi:uncharacterized membrane protein YgaE (UPF0421/DUF939 family)
MSKFITAFITFVLEAAAFLCVLAGGVLGFGYGEPQEMEFFYAAVGAGLGFVFAAVAFGVPLVILRINQNLEEMNRTLVAIKGRLDTRGNDSPQASRISPVEGWPVATAAPERT